MIFNSFKNKHKKPNKKPRNIYGTLFYKRFLFQSLTCRPSLSWHKRLKLILQEMVAASLGVPANRIMCHVKRIGGAFGGKLLKAGLLASVAAVAANK